jgi:hypothetical protein
MPIFLAMRTSLGEVTDRTQSFSDGLPVSPRARGWIRLAGGAAVLIVPILVGGVLLTAGLATGIIEQAPRRTHDVGAYVSLEHRPTLSASAAVELLWIVAAGAACSASMLYLLLSLLGTVLRVESHLGFAGAPVATFWVLSTGVGVSLRKMGLLGAADWLGAALPESMIVNYSYTGVEGGGYGDLLVSTAVAAPLLVNTVFQIGLAAIFVRRYGRRLTRGAASQQIDRAHQTRRRWAIRLPNRAAALAWLTVRQAAPMCLAGLLVAAVMALMEFKAVSVFPIEPLVWSFIDALPSNMWFIGVLWAVVVGAGTFATEMDWRIGEFWRTLPISAGSLFAVKFIVGLFTVLMMLDASIVAAAWNSRSWGSYHAMNWPYIACFIPLHATMFAMTVALTCTLRRPVVGAMLAIGALMLVNLTLDWFNADDFDPIQVYNHFHHRAPSGTQGSLDFTAHNYPLVAAAMGLILLLSAVLGWLALRRYDPRRQMN